MKVFGTARFGILPERLNVVSRFNCEIENQVFSIAGLAKSTYAKTEATIDKITTHIDLDISGLCAII